MKRAALSIRATACRTFSVLINMVLTARQIGREFCGYATITGQGNGQGGREHGAEVLISSQGHKLADPEAREYIAGVWGMPPQEMLQPGVDAYEIFRQIERDSYNSLLALLQSSLSTPGQRLRPQDVGQARLLRGDRILPEREGTATQTSSCLGR